MKNKILGTVSVAAMAVANVGQAGSPEPFVAVIPPVAPVLVSDFNGFYAGAAVTSTNAELLLEFSDGASGSDTYDYEGVGGAVYAGYNFAPSAVGFFYGGEVAYGMPNASYADFDSLSLDSLLSVHGRAGYVSGPLMYYATAGFAAGTTDCDACGGDSTFNETLSGYVIGAGVEYLITDSLSVRGQYEHFDLTGGAHDEGGYVATTSLTANVLSVGLNYHF